MPEQQITVVADSVEFYGDTRLLYLIGNVDYREPRLTLKSRRLTYWLNDEHLRAEGNVDATLPSGTKLTGPEVDYYRPGARYSNQLPHGRATPADDSARGNRFHRAAERPRRPSSRTP